MKEIASLLAHIDQQKTELDTYRPLPAITAKSLRDKLALDWTYHSNAIDGNTLTLSETKVVIEDGIAVGHKTMREHFEAINHHDAIEFVDEQVTSPAASIEWQLMRLHQLLMANINTHQAGKYRKSNVIIAGLVPTDHLLIDNKMTGLAHWYQSGAQQLHPIDRAAQLHTRFVEIHPFANGNGRTARLLLNLELMREGYPVAIIQQEDRVAYFNAVEKSCVELDHTDFTLMVAFAVSKSLDLYLQVVTGKNRT